MDENNLAEIANLPAAELLERLPALSADDLKALRKIEKAGANRADVHKAISGALTAAAKAPPAAAQVGDEQEGASSEAAPPAWQAADYDGPLTIPQAAWRRHNIKPAGRVRQK